MIDLSLHLLSSCFGARPRVCGTESLRPALKCTSEPWVLQQVVCNVVGVRHSIIRLLKCLNAHIPTLKLGGGKDRVVSSETA